MILVVTNRQALEDKESVIAVRLNKTLSTVINSIWSTPKESRYEQVHVRVSYDPDIVMNTSELGLSSLLANLYDVSYEKF